MKCGGCKTTRYCSRACQKTDWKAGQHKQVCKASHIAANADLSDSDAVSEQNPAPRLVLVAFRLALSVTPTKALLAENMKKKLANAMVRVQQLESALSSSMSSLSGSGEPMLHSGKKEAEAKELYGTAGCEEWLRGYCNFLRQRHALVLSSEQ
jgi:hypothetical protein